MTIKMKNPPLDQIEGQREGDQARKLSQPMNLLIRRAGQQGPPRGASRSQSTNLDESTHQKFNTGDDDVTPAREAQDERQWHPSSSPMLDRSLEVCGVPYMLSTTNTPTGEHITGVQNVRDSMDMLPTWKLQRMYTQSTGSSQSSVSRS
ncbi:hypothetical protein Tco_1434635 [Tanacetum coccineum]